MFQHNLYRQLVQFIIIREVTANCTADNIKQWFITDYYGGEHCEAPCCEAEYDIVQLLCNNNSNSNDWRI